MGRWIGALLVAVACASVQAFELPKEDGWSVLPTYGASRTVYVSASEGFDGQKGVSPDAPVKTLDRAMKLVKVGEGGAIYLKRGDTWEAGFSGVRMSGESAEKPLVISTYGEGPRPVISPKHGASAFDQKRWPLEHVVIEGIDFAIDPSASPRGVGITVLGPCNGLLIENCRITGFTMCVLLQGFTGRIENVTIRRSVIADSNAGGKHSSGLFAENGKNLVIDECVFDHNGWLAGDTYAVQTIFNHNMYVMPSVYGFSLRNSIVARASSHGVQARGGGDIENNVFVENPLSVLIGGGDQGREGGVTGKVIGNALLNGNDIGDQPRAWALELCNIKPGTGADVRDNIIAHSRSRLGGMAIIINGQKGGPAGYVGANNVTLANNVVWDWGMPLSIVFDDVSGAVISENTFMGANAGVPVIEYRKVSKLDPARINYVSNTYYTPTKGSAPKFRVALGRDGVERMVLNPDEWKTTAGEEGATFGAPDFVEPARDLVFYHESIGGEGSVAAFLAEARMQERGNWRTEYTASAALAYIRAGFERMGE